MKPATRVGLICVGVPQPFSVVPIDSSVLPTLTSSIHQPGRSTLVSVMYRKDRRIVCTGVGSQVERLGHPLGDVASARRPREARQVVLGERKRCGSISLVVCSFARLLYVLPPSVETWTNA